MERGNTKHGPAHDQEMARETEGMVRGSPQRAHGEEWRETEPVEGAVPPMRRKPGANPRPESRDIELRSELARVMSMDFFPAGSARHQLTGDPELPGNPHLIRVQRRVVTFGPRLLGRVSLNLRAETQPGRS